MSATRAARAAADDTKKKVGGPLGGGGKPAHGIKTVGPRQRLLVGDALGRVAEHPERAEVLAVGHDRAATGGQQDLVFLTLVVDHGDRDTLALVVADAHHTGGTGEASRTTRGTALEELDHAGQTAGDVLTGHTTGVEGTHRQLGAGLADGLGGDDADRLTDVDQAVRRQRTSVALGADALLALARQDRPDHDSLDAGGTDSVRTPRPTRMGAASGSAASPPQTLTGTPRVALFVTCLVGLVRPSIGFAAVKLIEQSGCTVDVPTGQTCCGQMHANSGYRGEAARLARRFVEVFGGEELVVSPSSSCVGCVRDLYPRLLGERPDGGAIELGWSDGRTRVERDTEIGVELLCEHVLQALQQPLPGLGLTLDRSELERLKKLKLRVKDQMNEIMSRHRAQQVG